MANPHPTTAILADQLRRTIAARRDRLVARQRRGYSPARAALIDRLGEEYRATYGQALVAGLR